MHCSTCTCGQASSSAGPSGSVVGAVKAVPIYARSHPPLFRDTRERVIGVVTPYNNNGQSLVLEGYRRWLEEQQRIITPPPQLPMPLGEAETQPLEERIVTPPASPTVISDSDDDYEPPRPARARRGGLLGGRGRGARGRGRGAPRRRRQTAQRGRLGNALRTIIPNLPAAPSSPLPLEDGTVIPLTQTSPNLATPPVINMGEAVDQTTPAQALEDEANEGGHASLLPHRSAAMEVDPPEVPASNEFIGPRPPTILTPELETVDLCTQEPTQPPLPAAPAVAATTRSYSPDPFALSSSEDDDDDMEASPPYLSGRRVEGVVAAPVEIINMPPNTQVEDLMAQIPASLQIPPFMEFQEDWGDDVTDALDEIVNLHS